MTDQYASFFKCLSAPSRNRIVQMLAQQGELSVEDLSSRVGLKEPTVSRHLQLLALHGIVRFRPAHPVRYYALNEGFVAEKVAEFLESIGVATDGSRSNAGPESSATRRNPSPPGASKEKRDTARASSPRQGRANKGA